MKGEYMSNLLKFRENMIYSISLLRKTVYPCKKCGNIHLNFNNFKGWSNFSITCQKCRQTIHGESPKETIDNWNKENEFNLKGL